MVSGAIRRVMETAGVSPAELAERLGVNASTVSRLVSGESEPSIERIAQIEKALGVPAGRIYRSAGLVADDDGRTTQDIIECDPLLTVENMRFVVRTYNVAVEASSEERRRSSDNAAPMKRRTRRN